MGKTTDEQENDLVVITVVQRTEGGGAESLAPFSLSGQHRLSEETFRLRPVLREEPGCGKTDERSSEFHSGQLVLGERGGS